VQSGRTCMVVEWVCVGGGGREGEGEVEIVCKIMNVYISTQ
jgi:hypothetical protein